MGIPASLLRNPSNGTPNLTFALAGGINSETPTSFYTDASGSLSLPPTCTCAACTSPRRTPARRRRRSLPPSRRRGRHARRPRLADRRRVVRHADNPLTALQFGSYQASINRNPAQFPDPYALRDVVFPQGTTGGTLASNFRNKMTAFGAVIPGQRALVARGHERMKIDSAVQMTKMMADGMLGWPGTPGPPGRSSPGRTCPG